MKADSQRASSGKSTVYSIVTSMMPAWENAERGASQQPQCNSLRRESSGGNREWEVERKSLMLGAQADCLWWQFGILMCDRWQVSAWDIFLVYFGCLTVSPLKWFIKLINVTWTGEFWFLIGCQFTRWGLIRHYINRHNGNLAWRRQSGLDACTHSCWNIPVHI